MPQLASHLRGSFPFRGFTRSQGQLRGQRVVSSWGLKRLDPSRYRQIPRTSSWRLSSLPPSHCLLGLHFICTANLLQSIIVPLMTSSYFGAKKTTNWVTSYESSRSEQCPISYGNPYRHSSRRYFVRRWSFAVIYFFTNQIILLYTWLYTPQKS